MNGNYSSRKVLEIIPTANQVQSEKLSVPTKTLTSRHKKSCNLVLTTGLKASPSSERFASLCLALRQSDLHRSDEGLTLETSAFLPFTVANLHFQPSC